MSINNDIKQNSTTNSTLDYEKFFFFEVVVFDVYINEADLQLDEDVISSFRETCVMFQFLHYPPLVICEKDFCVYGNQNSLHPRKKLKSGKSSLFPLKTLRQPLKPMNFDIKVSVAKKLPEGVLPEKLIIANTSVNIGSSFTRLMTEDPEKVDECLIPKIMRDKYDLFNDQGKKVGDITVFIRLSTLGKYIITQFKLGENEKEYYFKGIDAEKSFKGLQAPVKTARNEVLDTRQTGDQKYSYERQPEQQLRKHERSSDYKFSNDLEMYTGKGAAEREWDEEQERQKYYKEKPTDYGYYDIDRACPCAPKLNLCDCDYPIPMELMPTCPAFNNKPHRSDSKSSIELPPGVVGLRGDQVIFQMPTPAEPGSEKDKKPASPMMYKVGTVDDGKECSKQIVQIIPQNPDEIPGPSDKEDVFILKIGKKGEGVKGNKNFEVELRTPKMKEPKPETTNQETQTTTMDAEPTKKGKQKKDKKGKGKKKK
uniref:DUF4776 domain-containing protein n=1 Tax=Clastoptera arizonana TaxID=38151 RepID=A0A1B6CLG1_9HEMI